MFTPPLPDRAGAGDLRRLLDTLAKEAMQYRGQDSPRDREELRRVLNRIDKVRAQYHMLYNKKVSHESVERSRIVCC
jgi:hypothetical protein